MNYINTDTLEYPVTQAEIRARFPNITFPEAFVAPAPYAPVYAANPPSFDPASQTLVPNNQPTLVGDQWLLGWTVMDLAQEEINATLANDRAAMWERIKAIRDSKTQRGGVNIAKVTDNGDGTFTMFNKWFHTDTFSRTQYTGFIILGENAPVGLQWKTMDGSFVEMNAPLMDEICAAIAAKDAAIFAHAEALRAEVNASTAPTTVDITSGWPPVYGE